MDKNNLQYRKKILMTSHLETSKVLYCRGGVEDPTFEAKAKD